ncbi:hypothetical protein RhiirC2_801221, partial [Rhizophagus irregularis]
RRATGKNIRFIPKCYLEHPLSKLLLNTNLKSLWVSADEDNDNTAIWTKLAQFRKDEFLKEKKHFKNYLLSESSREYEIFRQMFAGMSVRSIRYLRAKEVDVVTNPELIYENILKFSRLIKALNWNGPVVGMTDYELGGIVGSTLKLSETSVQTYDDIHNVINYIKQKKAIATQVKVIVLKIPIEKIPPLVISMLPTNGGI